MSSSPIALVAGGSRGLGLLIGRALLHRGYEVVLLARDHDELERARADLSRLGPTHAMVCDVRDADAAAAAVTAIESEHGPVEVAITVAGIIQVGPAESFALEHFRDAIETMTFGPVHVAWAVLPGMRGRDRGRIGTVTSIGGMVSPPHLLPYATAKFGAVGFSDGLAAALAPTGITATTVVPGLMRTGSHVSAQFSGDDAAEYAWFAPAASLPLLSMDADRAAGRIVDGVLRGSPIVVLTPMAWVAIRVRGLLPGTTTRLMGLAGRVLPSAPATAGPDGEHQTVPGRRAAERLDSSVVRRLTRWGAKATRRTNQQGRSQVAGSAVAGSAATESAAPNETR